MSNKTAFGKKEFKYFIGYKDTNIIKPSCVFLRKMTAYRKDFDKTKYVSLLIKDDRLLEKYNEIWDKVSYAIGKELDSNLVYNKIYLTAIFKIMQLKIKHSNKTPKEDSQFICLLVILIDSVGLVKIITLKYFYKSVGASLKKDF